MEQVDIAVIGAGPAGASAAAWAARGGASVALFEKATQGRDKSCGDGLTPRAIEECRRLGIDVERFHRIDGLRVQAGSKVREVLWPDGAFPPVGAVAPRANSMQWSCRPQLIPAPTFVRTRQLNRGSKATGCLVSSVVAKKCALDSQ